VLSLLEEAEESVANLLAVHIEKHPPANKAGLPRET
jgi:hypothetical protein